MNKDHLSQESEIKVLHIVKQEGVYPDKYISGFEKFKELPSKGKSYCSLKDKEICAEEYEHVIKVWD